MRKSTGQKKVYDYIVEYVTEHLYAPSIRDICRACGYTSTGTVYTHLYSLQRKGLIEIGEYHSPRTIKLVGYKLVKE